MSSSQHVDGVLVQWGERLFYPRNRIVKVAPAPHLVEKLARRKAAVIRSCIEATVRRAPQVMVKVTGGGRGMVGIAAHFRYITKNGRLPFEDDRGVVQDGKEALRDLERQWRLGGSLIEDHASRREAFNIMLSMPRGTDPLTVQRAAREFAKIELADHRYVMVLHDHQANPHVHLSVRAESNHGKRLNPRKADLHRWRETFAERLREWGIDAEATRQATRGESRRSEALWRIKAQEKGRTQEAADMKSSPAARTNRAEAIRAWIEIAKALDKSELADDKRLAQSIARYIYQMPFAREYLRNKELERSRQQEQHEPRPFERSLQSDRRVDRGIER
jgi:hypothetical protein